MAVSSGGPSGGFKPTKIGKTGVKLRYYKQKAFIRLKDEQKAELTLWRDEQERKKGGKCKRGGSNGSGSDGNDYQKKFKDLTSHILALASFVVDLKWVTEKLIVFKDQLEAHSTSQSILKFPIRPTQCKKSGN